MAEHREESSINPMETWERMKSSFDTLLGEMKEKVGEMDRFVRSIVVSGSNSDHRPPNPPDILSTSSVAVKTEYTSNGSYSGTVVVTQNDSQFITGDLLRNDIQSKLTSEENEHFVEEHATLGILQSTPSRACGSERSQCGQKFTCLNGKLIQDLSPQQPKDITVKEEILEDEQSLPFGESVFSLITKEQLGQSINSVISDAASYCNRNLDGNVDNSDLTQELNSQINNDHIDATHLTESIPTFINLVKSETEDQDVLLEIKRELEEQQSEQLSKQQKEITGADNYSTQQPLISNVAHSDGTCSLKRPREVDGTNSEEQENTLSRDQFYKIKKEIVSDPVLLNFITSPNFLEQREQYNSGKDIDTILESMGRTDTEKNRNCQSSEFSSESNYNLQQVRVDSNFECSERSAKRPRVNANSVPPEKNNHERIFQVKEEIVDEVTMIELATENRHELVPNFERNLMINEEVVNNSTLETSHIAQNKESHNFKIKQEIADEEVILPAEVAQLSQNVNLTANQNYVVPDSLSQHQTDDYQLYDSDNDPEKLLEIKQELGLCSSIENSHQPTNSVSTNETLQSFEQDNESVPSNASIQHVDQVNSVNHDNDEEWISHAEHLIKQEMRDEDISTLQIPTLFNNPPSTVREQALDTFVDQLLEEDISAAQNSTNTCDSNILSQAVENISLSNENNYLLPKEEDGEVFGKYLNKLKCFHPDCCLFFSTKREHGSHMKEAHNMLPIPCPVKNCKESFTVTAKWKTHAKKQHPNVSRCDICNAMTGKLDKNAMKLIKHHSLNHQRGEYQCIAPGCSFVAKYLVDVNQHANKENHPMPTSREFD